MSLWLWHFLVLIHELNQHLKSYICFCFKEPCLFCSLRYLLHLVQCLACSNVSVNIIEEYIPVMFRASLALRLLEKKWTCLCHQGTCSQVGNFPRSIRCAMERTQIRFWLQWSVGWIHIGHDFRPWVRYVD